MAVSLWLAPLVGYFLGSIPSGYIMGRLTKGINLPAQGKTTGTLSVMRHAGIVPGIITLAMDMGKGVAAVLIARWMGAPELVILGSGLTAIIGHNWPVFIGFRGGRGLATSIAVLATVMPLPLASSLCILLIVWPLSRNISLAGGLTIAFLPLIAWLWGASTMLIFYPLVIAVPLAVRSVPDFIRDLRGKVHPRGQNEGSQHS